MNMQQAYKCLDCIDDLRRDMIVKSLSSRLNIIGNEECGVDNKG